MATLGSVIGRGVTASRPAAGTEGRLYYDTDTSTMYRDNGSTWDSVEGDPGVSYTDEQAQDAVGSILSNTPSISLTYDDATPFISAEANFGVDAGEVAEGDHTHIGLTPGAHTHPSTDITDFAEATDDRVDALLAVTSPITKVYSDVGNSLTLAVDSSALNELIDDRVAALLAAGADITLTYDDGAGTLTIAATGGGGGSSLQQVYHGWTAGKYYSTYTSLYFDTNSAVATLPAGPNVLVASPIYVPRTNTVDRIGFSISSGQAAGTARCGIYENDTSGKPGALLLDAGTVSVATSGDKEITISQELEGGKWYWLAMASGVDISIFVVKDGRPTSGNSSLGVGSRWGSPYIALSGGFSALPNPFGAATFGQVNTYHISVRAGTPS